eukprot:52171_1
MLTLFFPVHIVASQTPVISSDSGHYVGGPDNSHIYSSDLMLDGFVGGRCWNSGGDGRTLPSWVVFDFKVPVKIDTFDWVNGGNDWMVEKSYLQYNEGGYKTLKTISSPEINHPDWVANVINGTIYARYWRWYIIDTYNNLHGYVCEVQFGATTASPTESPTTETFSPTSAPSVSPTIPPTDAPSSAPSVQPSGSPTTPPTYAPSNAPLPQTSSDWINKANVNCDDGY